MHIILSRMEVHSICQKILIQRKIRKKEIAIKIAKIITTKITTNFLVQCANALDFSMLVCVI